MNFPGLSFSLILLALAATASAAIIVVLRPYLQRYALARPNRRSSHKLPTAQGGGIAVIAATLLTGIAAILVLGGDVVRSPLIIVFVATVLIAATGALDDIRELAAAPRLAMQTICVGAVLWSLPGDLLVFPGLPVWGEKVLLLIGGLWFVNLINFMDGLDWLIVAMVVPVTGALALAGVAGALPGEAIVIALALCGATMGFAPFNRPVARLFLGDVGSLPIGLLLAWLLAQLAGRGHLAAAVLLPLYYCADATITLVRRLINREALMEAHRTHFYQRATDNGFRVPQIVARVFAINVLLAVLALGTVLYPSATIQMSALLIGAAAVAALLFAFSRRAH
jgi:UDP-N-acetylmuramyl pentapeptide phosphotransferase/UDP-N-acetylglucosamine-1-phosphate transferase